MRPFNLEEYIKMPFKAVVTRDGKKVRILCTNANCDTPIVALVNKGYAEVLTTYDKLGRSEFYADDLFFTTVKNKGWVEVYESPEGKRFPGKTIYATKEEAEKNAHSSRVSIAKIEWKE